MTASDTQPSGARDMVLIAGGVTRMGSAAFYADEGPVHDREIAPFWIDRYEVTNADYARFVDETGYVTVAERALDPSEFAGANPADLVPGAMVFTPTSGPVNLGDWRNWWRWQPGAYWWAPFGPGSSASDRLDHPAVHIAYEDAAAYAEWAGARLPTEAEYEYAARGGREGAEYAWGNEPYPGGVPQANSWIGRFPYDNQGEGGTAAVGSYPPNGYGLYDMIGNVWEWTTSFYAPMHILHDRIWASPDGRTNLLAAAGGAGNSDGGEAASGPPRRVLKGGSHLCSPDYCLRFRPAARSPQTEDTGMSHIGFRCARDA